jgi:hypothetical protein
MKRKGHIVALVALGLMATAIRTTPAYDKLVTSVHTFQHCLNGLQASNSSLSPIERVVFSLVLANTKAPRAERPAATPQRRS